MLLPVLAWTCGDPAWAGEVVYVPEGAAWRYLPGLEEASTPISAWRERVFEDGSWDGGPAPFGYGDGPFGTDLSQLDPPMRENYSTLFLRREFQVAQPDAVVELHATVDYDDGFLIWINGEEVARVNVAGSTGDPVTHDQFSAGGHESGTPEEFTLPNPGSYLVAGTNVLAVQVFNTSITSSDLRLEIRLFDPFGPDLAPPVLAGLVPAAGATIRRLSRVEVRFDEAVVGVDAADLLVAGSAATGISGSGAGPYTFTFSEPPQGEVLVEWAAGHGITDTAEAANAFAGGSWSYVLDPDAPEADLVITEFVARNADSLADSDGDSSDWVEIVNRGLTDVDLHGWSLTDDEEEPGLYVLPSRVLPAGDYLVIFASGKDKVVGNEIHANFQLSSEGGYLGLYAPELPRRVASELRPYYPPQRTDISYGLTPTGEFSYLATPTPGAPNSTGTSFEGIVAAPRVSVPRGFFDGPVEVGLTSATPGSSVRYTLDGSEPDRTHGTLYSGPVRITTTSHLRVVAYRAGWLPSEVVTHSYIFPDDVLDQPALPSGFPTSWPGTSADYEMDPRVISVGNNRSLGRNALLRLPSLSIVGDMYDLFDSSHGAIMNPSREGIAWERPVSAEFMYPSGRDGIQVNCGFRIQGGSSTSGWKSKKNSMRLLFKDDYGPGKLDYALFSDTHINSFDTIVLDAHLNLTWTHPDHGQRVRSQYVRDAYVSDLQNAMGSYGPHDVFVNLFVNGLFWGVYDVHERPDASFGAEYFGGDDSEYDALRHSGSTVVDGDGAAWNTMMGMARRDLSSNSNYEALQSYLDVPDLIDYMITNIYVGNDDWPRHNWYATRRRLPGGLFRFHSWDAEHVLKSTSINQTGVSNTNSPAEIYSLLRQNAEFRLLFADHVHRHFFNKGSLYVDESNPNYDEESPGNNLPAEIYMERIREVDAAMVLESARWGDVRRPEQPYLREVEWLDELRWLLDDYFPDRSGNVLNQLRSADLYPDVDAPVFSRNSGLIQPGTLLSMSLPTGTTGQIVFTTDGSDPRVYGTGGVTPGASVYSGPIALNELTLVKARTLSGSTWSALNEATYTLPSPLGAVRITELMYHPQEGREYEFLEIGNTVDVAVDLSTLRFTNGIRFFFAPGTHLGPGERLVVVADAASFEAAYPGVPYAGQYLGALDNGGEKVTLQDADERTIDSVDYDDEDFWPVGPDGFGYSLVIIDPAGDPDDPENWRASAQRGGSPGEEDPQPEHGGVIISEILPRAAPPFECAIELHNRTGGGIPLGGWYLSRNKETEESLSAFRIPDGTMLAAGGHVVLYAGDFSAGPGGFVMDPAGDEVYLSAAGAGGGLSGYITSFQFRAAELNRSFGRYETSDGLDVAAMADSSFGVDSPATIEEFRGGTGAPNGLPSVGSVVINEINYHPYPGEQEFVELYNTTDSPVPLYDAALDAGWRVDGLTNAAGTGDFEFAPGDEVPARGYLLLVGIGEEDFRSLYGLPGDVVVVGPYNGVLDNGGESIKLLRPEAVGDGKWGLLLVDKVSYNDLAPWPVRADGRGPSLERILPLGYGNEPLNWDDSDGLSGTPGAYNSVSPPIDNDPPEASFSFSPTVGQAPLEVTFDARDSRDPDGSIVDYEWTFGDGASDSGVLAVHIFQTPGDYRVTLRVLDDDGAPDTVSQTVRVTDEPPPGGLQRPGDLDQNGRLDISDAVALLGHLFLGSPSELPCGNGTILDPANRTLYDSDGNGNVDLTDAIGVLSFLFQGGPPPVLGTTCIRIVGCEDACVP